MNYREATKKLRKLGCTELSDKGRGSHRRWYNPNKTPAIVVSIPDWGSRDLKTGTLRSVIEDLGLDWEDFKNA